MITNRAIDTETGGTYAANLYSPGGSMPAIDTLDDFDADARKIYDVLGCLSIERVFDDTKVSEGLDGLKHLLMGGNPDFDGVQYEAWAAEKIESLDGGQRMDAVRKLMYFTPYDSRLKALAYHPPLIRVLETIIGEPVRMFQDMALLKPPRGGREKPWHQDKAYFDFPLETRVVGVWIALDEATAENGCMHLLPGTHRHGPVVHFRRRDWQICDTDILGKQCVVAPLQPGGLLVFDGLIQHGTPRNNSQKRRRAVQFHYAPASAVEASKDQRLKIFGSEGKDVTC